MLQFFYSSTSSFASRHKSKSQKTNYLFTLVTRSPDDSLLCGSKAPLAQLIYSFQSELRKQRRVTTDCKSETIGKKKKEDSSQDSHEKASSDEQYGNGARLVRPSSPRIVIITGTRLTHISVFFVSSQSPMPISLHANCKEKY